MDKTTNLGIIDSWLRGVCGMVPRSALPASSDPGVHGESIAIPFLDANTHNLTYGSYKDIHQQDIRNMRGFLDLLTACCKNNVALDLRGEHLDDEKQGRLVVNFKPKEPFASSRIFGTKYSNVIAGDFAPRR
jgi:hypothetical protein